MVAAGSERLEGGRQIPQAVAKGKLSETDAENLVVARELLGAVSRAGGMLRVDEVR